MKIKKKSTDTLVIVAMNVPKDMYTIVMVNVNE